MKKIEELSGCLEQDVSIVLDRYHKEKTKEHVFQVAKKSVALARQFHVDERICFEAALLHDISAIVSPLEMLEIANEYGLLLDPAEKKYPFLLHQRISVIFAKEFFNIDNEDILSAIGCHTTLNAHPSVYDMIVFLADKIAWDQQGEPPYLAMLEKDLEISLQKACFDFIEMQWKEGRLLYPHQWIKEAYADLQEYMNHCSE